MPLRLWPAFKQTMCPWSNNDSKSVACNIQDYLSVTECSENSKVMGPIKLQRCPCETVLEIQQNKYKNSKHNWLSHTPWCANSI